MDEGSSSSLCPPFRAGKMTVFGRPVIVKEIVQIEEGGSALIKTAVGSEKIVHERGVHDLDVGDLGGVILQNVFLRDVFKP